ncbi:hypothetical protein ALP89_200223 [Pseudomonas syringae pv. persicae]|nr:hypothetical protein ALP89_200223 [Pseudomonas syringae pv. persicae]
MGRKLCSFRSQNFLGSYGISFTWFNEHGLVCMHTRPALLAVHGIKNYAASRGIIGEDKCIPK